MKKERSKAVRQINYEALNEEIAKFLYQNKVEDLGISHQTMTAIKKKTRCSLPTLLSIEGATGKPIQYFLTEK